MTCIVKYDLPHKGGVYRVMRIAYITPGYLFSYHKEKKIN